MGCRGVLSRPRRCICRRNRTGRPPRRIGPPPQGGYYVGGEITHPYQPQNTRQSGPDIPQLLEVEDDCCTVIVSLCEEVTQVFE